MMSSINVHSSELLTVESREQPLNLNITPSEKKQQSTKPNIVKPMPSSVLSRVQAFLPQLEKANTELEQRLAVESAESLDIENVAEGTDYIEMNLALVAGEVSTDDEDSSDESDADAAPISLGRVTESNLKLPVGNKKRPVIEEITEKKDAIPNCEGGEP